MCEELKVGNLIFASSLLGRRAPTGDKLIRYCLAAVLTGVDASSLAEGLDFRCSLFVCDSTYQSKQVKCAPRYALPLVRSLERG